VSDTVPLKDAPEIKLRRYLAVPPATTVCEVELVACADKKKTAPPLATVTVTEKGAVFPELSVATALMTWLPFVAERVFHDIVYGADVTCEPRGTPSIAN
jgi:hypothetical protein